jgi:hypothetical protein
MRVWLLVIVLVIDFIRAFIKLKLEPLCAHPTKGFQTLELSPAGLEVLRIVITSTKANIRPPQINCQSWSGKKLCGLSLAATLLRV